MGTQIITPFDIREKMDRLKEQIHSLDVERDILVDELTNCYTMATAAEKPRDNQKPLTFGAL